MKKAVTDEIAAILPLSEGVFFSVNRRKKGKLPKGSIIITSEKKNGIKGFIISISLYPLSSINPQVDALFAAEG
jgi:hypothetical protein